MPGLDTLKAFQEWSKENPLNREALVVGISASAAGADQDEAFRCGMHFFCSKALDFGILSLILHARQNNTDLDTVINVVSAQAGVHLSRPNSAQDKSSPLPTTGTVVGEAKAGGSGGVDATAAAVANAVAALPAGPAPPGVRGQGGGKGNRSTSFSGIFRSIRQLTHRRVVPE